ncbi:ShlB/FhaC/HecB family hemolysin secretion/activation protein [Sphingomonas sp. LT1P40]|uniref:ShlB/FhaC/HecB family hemolysin secretion/activation protein n=1 Tax=Alteristakelama amylovorans TaxID=3096166 RepID=UPI002FCB5EAE
MMLVSLMALAAVADPQDGTRLIDRNRIDRPKTAPKIAPMAPRERARIAASGTGRPIKGVRFRGVDAPGPVAKAAEDFLGRAMTAETLAELAGTLSRAYEKSDVALYTVAIPEQDFADDVVVVLLTEGRVAKLNIAGEARRHRQLRGRAAPLTQEAPLSRVTFERQFTLMRALPGLTLDTAFADPDGTGALILTLTPKQRRSKFTLGFSNRGVDLTGDGQFDALAEFYGLAVDGDQLSFAASAASDFKRYRYGALGYQAPVGTSGLTASVNAAYLETRPKGIPLKGTAKLAGATLSYPLIRGFRRNADISLGLDGIDSDNAVLGNLIATERTRALRAAAGISDSREKRAWSLSVAASQGLDFAGARVIEPFAEKGFRKISGAASAAQMLGKRVTLRLNLSGQYSGDRLPAAERFAVGGEALGRAFDTAFLTADKGAGALGEVAVRPIKGGGFSASELYAFADRAWIGIAARGLDPAIDLSMASAGAGARVRFKEKGELGIEAAKAIDDPYPGYDEDWRVSVMWKLSL